MDYENLDPSGSLMEKIQALIQPPQSEESAKKAKKTEKEPRRTGGAVNHDHCDSCGEGGDLLCCDRCPCAFHFSCCDPPLEEDDIPQGEWLCNECRSNPKKSTEDGTKVLDGKESNQPEKKKEEETRERVKDRRSSNDSPFETLVKMSSGKNPKTFSLPPELKCNTVFPGDRKRKNSTEEKAPPAKNGKRHTEEEEHGALPARFCFACTRSELKAPLLQCDFCPLAFHLDCLSPPMTTMPSGMWMCPNHAEHAEPGLRAPRFSKRVQAYDDLRSNISQHTIKLDFLQRVRRLRNHPGNRHKKDGSRRKAVTVVPKAVKDHYASPPTKFLPQHIQRMQQPLPQYSLPLQGPTTQEQDEWLKAVVELQCGIATHMTQLNGIKAQSTSPSPDNQTIKTTAQTTAGSSNGTATNLDATSTLTCAVLGPGSSGMTANVGKIVPGVVKSVLPNHVNTSSVNSQCFNKVITTTITTTSGGKTVTKPVTILYASPAKSAGQVNGHITNAVKVIPTTSTSPAKAATCTMVTPVIKHEPRSPVETKQGVLKQGSVDLKSSQSSLLTDCKKLANDLHMNNVIKPKLEAGKTILANNAAPKAVVVSGSQIVGSSAKNITGTPTKLIVLTSTGGNIIKTIPTSTPITTTAATPTAVTTTSGSPGKVAVAGSSPAQRIVLTSSPSRSQQVSVIPAAMTTANAINTLCASTGGDGLQVTELAKLDPKLIQVLAYQRLQQLLTQAKPVPPSPAASSKRMTFNGLKETFVLPQQSVPIGKSIAVICPLNGVGPVYPMMHKSIIIGKGSDKDICLSSYGHCNFISERHSCIFYDDVSKQYELLNYSEHGTYVDNVLYSCDFSDKPTRQVISSKNLDSSKVTPNKLLEASKSKQKTGGVRCTSGLSVLPVSKPCNCSASSSSLIGGSGAGWEGTALLHHGSYIKVGCIQFVFSIVSQSNKSSTKSSVPSTLPSPKAAAASTSKSSSNCQS